MYSTGFIFCSRASFPQKPPSQWSFSFIPCPSVCSGPNLSASYFLPPGFRYHLKQSLKIWLQITQIGNTLRDYHVRFPQAFCSMIQEISCSRFSSLELLEDTVKKNETFEISDIYGVFKRKYSFGSLFRGQWHNTFLICMQNGVRFHIFCSFSLSGLYSAGLTSEPQ